jgi:hypothetical protein
VKYETPLNSVSGMEGGSDFEVSSWSWVGQDVQARQTLFTLDSYIHQPKWVSFDSVSSSVVVGGGCCGRRMGGLLEECWEDMEQWNEGVYAQGLACWRWRRI